tara:strand:+ start:272 stop:583 length:312 start_codon:yes stop_codon:yes gene_type:complete
MILSIIGIVLGIIAIGLVFWYKKDNNMSTDLLEGDTKNIEQAFIALQKEFTEYQVFNERKREELEKIILKNRKNSERSIEKIYKDLEPEIKNNKIRFDNLINN